MHGPIWAQLRFKQPGLSATQRAVILTCLPSEPPTWELARSEEAIDEAYWKQAHPYSRGSAEDVEYAARRLIRFGRAFSAAELLAFRLKDANPASPSLIADALEAALHQKEVDARNGSFSYWAGELLDTLGAAPDFDEMRVARLEWGFAPILQYDRPLTVLHRPPESDSRKFLRIIRPSSYSLISRWMAALMTRSCRVEAPVRRSPAD